MVKRGWLSKRQKGEWRGWRRRLFELHSGYLRYYRNARVRTLLLLLLLAEGGALANGLRCLLCKLCV